MKYTTLTFVVLTIMVLILTVVTLLNAITGNGGFGIPELLLALVFLGAIGGATRLLNRS